MDNSFSIGLRLKQINGIIISDINRMLKKYDLTFSQNELLQFLRANGGSLPQKAIESEFGIAHTSVITLLKRTEKKGFITVTVDENDRRRRIVTLTDKGAPFFEETMKQKEKHDALTMQGFTNEELETFIELLDKLYANLIKGKEASND